MGDCYVLHRYENAYQRHHQCTINTYKVRQKETKYNVCTILYQWVMPFKRRFVARHRHESQSEDAYAHCACYIVVLKHRQTWSLTDTYIEGKTKHSRCNSQRAFPITDAPFRFIHFLRSHFHRLAFFFSHSLSRCVCVARLIIIIVIITNIVIGHLVNA